ncbi:unnamed protein product [Pocillopora meandrina]|uniref:Uncharacterized protein n=1 Tax=Pocillopora meandrina TaxID=46732 RepID=A0AAU9VXE9_9CNID|nr:unnamed protein product [Pocillopora meandrina]
MGPLKSGATRHSFKKTFVGTIFGGLVYLILTKESLNKIESRRHLEKVAKNLSIIEYHTFSCIALDRIGLTNHHIYLGKICINGQFYSWYFFDCITKVYTA